MKYTPPVLSVVAAILAVSSLLAQPAQNANVPKIRFESVPDFLKYSPDMNLGEVLGVAINSKGTLVVLNHPGSATVGPLYGNASTQILEFDANGKFVREVGKASTASATATASATTSTTTSGSSTRARTRSRSSIRPATSR